LLVVTLATRGDMAERYAIDRYRVIEHPTPLRGGLVTLGVLRGRSLRELTEHGRPWAAAGLLVDWRAAKCIATSLSAKTCASVRNRIVSWSEMLTEIRTGAQVREDL
jgi:hypothetical protein